METILCYCLVSCVNMPTRDTAASASAPVPPSALFNRIFELRGVSVMLDSDLAELYGVETKALNRAVRRNAARFPSDFVFTLTAAEFGALRRQNGTSKLGGVLNIESVTSQTVISKPGRGGAVTCPTFLLSRGLRCCPACCIANARSW
jgi:hypothetical protein